MSEYRQLHFNEVNPGLWPAIEGVQTQIPADRKIDGVADVTLKSYEAIALGEKQSQLAQADEINLFSRTLLYAASPDNSNLQIVYKEGYASPIIDFELWAITISTMSVKERIFHTFEYNLPKSLSTRPF